MNSLKYLIIFVFLSSSVFGQTTNWSNAYNWKLYSTSPRNLDTLPKDSLSKYPFSELNKDTIDQFLRAATPIPIERTKGAVWMGVYWVSYQIGSSLCILKVSKYGGFFVDENDGLYYELPVEERQQWLEYFSHQSILLQERKYLNP
jgi:hypothetical protein